MLIMSVSRHTGAVAGCTSFLATKHNHTERYIHTIRRWHKLIRQ